MTETATKYSGNIEERARNCPKLEDFGEGIFQKEETVHSRSEREQAGLNSLNT